MANSKIFSVEEADAIISGFEFTGYDYVTCNTIVVTHSVRAEGVLADGRRFRVSGGEYVEEVDNYYDKVSSDVVIRLEEGACMPLEAFLNTEKGYSLFAYR